MLRRRRPALDRKLGLVYLMAIPRRTLMATRTSVVPSSSRTRFCMLAYSFYEGDTRILQYATALAKRGDVVDVIALRRKGQPKHAVEQGEHVQRIQLTTVNEQERQAYLYRMLLSRLSTALVLA